ncbi:MAG: hypothetical protein E5X98_03255, partial [Mesorhizobium sp.]
RLVSNLYGGRVHIPLEKHFHRHRRQGDGRSCAILNSTVSGCKNKPKQGMPAMDLVVLGMGILFFVLSLAYVKACDRI